MVSIIITTCKRNPEIIKRAIKSVINQTYKDWELIVVDDSPSDYEYRDVVGEYVQSLSETHNVRYIKNKENSGACYSRNKGLDIARGEYLAYLDDDDEWLSNKIEEQVRVLQNASDKTALVYGPYICLDESSNEKKTFLIPERSGMLFDDLMRYGNFVGGMSMPMMRTSCVRTVGGFDEKMQAAQDIDLWLRLSQQFEMQFYAPPLVLYHIHCGEQISRNPEKKIAGIKRLYEKNKEYIIKHRTVNARYKRLLSLLYANWGHYKEAFYLWLKAICLDPFVVAANIKLLKQILIHNDLV